MAKQKSKKIKAPRSAKWESTSMPVASSSNLPAVRENDSIWDEMDRMRAQMNQLMDSFSDFPSLHSSAWSSPLMRPRADVWETETQVKAEIELPGMDKKDIQLNLSDGLLEVRAEKKYESREERKDFHRMERSFSHFSRTFSIPRNVDAGKAEARYSNGLLSISIPKTKRSNGSSRRLEIN